MKANIKELAAKAGLAKVMIHPTSDTGVYISLDAETENKLKEFAKLVALVCVNMPNEKIKEYFGIK